MEGDSFHRAVDLFYFPSSHFAVESAVHVISLPTPATVWQLASQKTARIKATANNTFLTICSHSVFNRRKNRFYNNNRGSTCKNFKYFDKIIQVLSVLPDMIYYIRETDSLKNLTFYAETLLK
jgi:hypothetical protein